MIQANKIICLLLFPLSVCLLSCNRGNSIVKLNDIPAMNLFNIVQSSVDEDLIIAIGDPNYLTLLKETESGLDIVDKLEGMPHLPTTPLLELGGYILFANNTDDWNGVIKLYRYCQSNELEFVWQKTVQRGSWIVLGAPQASKAIFYSHAYNEDSGEYDIRTYLLNVEDDCTHNIQEISQNEETDSGGYSPEMITNDFVFVRSNQDLVLYKFESNNLQEFKTIGLPESLQRPSLSYDGIVTEGMVFQFKHARGSPNPARFLIFTLDEQFNFEKETDIEVGTYSRGFEGIRLSEDQRHLAVFGRASILIYDVRDVANIELVDDLMMDSLIDDILISNERLYVTGGQHTEMKVFDLNLREN